MINIGSLTVLVDGLLCRFGCLSSIRFFLDGRVIRAVDVFCITEASQGKSSESLDVLVITRI